MATTPLKWPLPLKLSTSRQALLDSTWVAALTLALPLPWVHVPSMLRLMSVATRFWAKSLCALAAAPRKKKGVTSQFAQASG